MNLEEETDMQIKVEMCENDPQEAGSSFSTTPKEQITLSNTDEDIRSIILSRRYGFLQPNATTLEPGQAYLHFQTDDKYVNQGKCYYNNKQGTYYIKNKKPGNPGRQRKTDETVFMEIERYDGDTGHNEIQIFITGILNDKIANKL